MNQTRILFICHGNICRSAAAEMVFRKMAEELGKKNLFRIESAATSREEIGNDIYPQLCRNGDIPAILMRPVRRCVEITTGGII